MNTLARLVCVLSLLSAITLSATPRYPDSGIYDLTGMNRDFLPDSSYVEGRIIDLEWANVESSTTPGDYDFGIIEAALKRLAAEGKKVMIKINGGGHPAYLFSQVPYAAGVKFHHQVGDSKGTLMYWHPNYVARYQALLKAFGNYLAQTAYRDSVSLIRLNYNAIGTEITSVPGSHRSAKSIQNGGKWTYPAGMTDAGVPDWTGKVGDKYMRDVTQSFVDYILPHARVLARANLENHVATAFQDEFNNGRLGWFHTGAAMEENQYFDQEFRYDKFLEYCRPGITFGFTEHCDYLTKYRKKYGKNSFPRSQWNYWRVLSELHCGVAYIGTYGTNLRSTDPEMVAAFNFGAKYAGYHADPLNSPGTWVAVRGGGPDQKPAAGAPESAETEGWDNFRGDYNLLMSRIPGDGSVAVTAQGPNNQRYGSWARQLNGNGQMYFNINDDFFGGPLNGAYPVTIHVTYLDSGTGSLSIYYHSTRGEKLAGTITKTNPAKATWKTAAFTVPDGAFNNGLAKESDIRLSNSAFSPTVVHMVELTRATETYEAEKLPANANGRPESGVGSSLCSNWAYHRTLFTTGNANDWVEYTLNVPQAGTYNIRVVQVTGPDRGIWRLEINGTRGPFVNGYNSTEEVEQHDLGSVTLPAGKNTFRFQINKKSAESSNYHLGIDAIKLTKK